MKCFQKATVALTYSKALKTEIIDSTQACYLLRNKALHQKYIHNS